MIIEKTEFNGLLLIKPIVHQDERGYFFESFRDDYLKKIGLSGKFCQDNQTKSKKGTLRGLHYQLKYPQGKLRSEERRVGKECRSRWSPYH